MKIVFSGVALQPLAGLLLDAFWDRKMGFGDGISIYSFHAYQITLTILPVSFILALLIGRRMIKETCCKLQNEY